MKIEGIFSDEVLSGYPICLDTYGYLGFKHASYIDEDIKLFLKEMPDFEMVFSVFMNKPIKLFNNKILDICLSLFYNPYFDEFYDRVKQRFFQISFAKKKYLIKNMLKYLSDDFQYEGIVKRNLIDESLRDYYIEKDIYAKSKELLSLIK